MHYEIGGQQLTDSWFYVRHRWVFDLVLSNPNAVTLYRMSPAQYAGGRMQPLTRPRNRDGQGSWLGGRAAGDELARRAGGR